MGDNFIKSNPKIFKRGVLKKAQLRLKNGLRNESYICMFDGFNVVKLFASFSNKEYNLWQESRGHVTDNMKKAENRQKAMSMMDKVTGKDKKEEVVAPVKEEKLKRTLSQERRSKELNEKYKFVFEFLDGCHYKCEEEIRTHPEKKGVYAEKFDDKSLEGMYLEVWDLIKTHMKLNKEDFDRKEACAKKKKNLMHIKETL